MLEQCYTLRRILDDKHKVGGFRFKKEQSVSTIYHFLSMITKEKPSEIASHSEMDIEKDENRH